MTGVLTIESTMSHPIESTLSHPMKFLVDEWDQLLQSCLIALVPVKQ